MQFRELYYNTPQNLLYLCYFDDWYLAHLTYKLATQGMISIYIRVAQWDVITVPFPLVDLKLGRD